MAANSYEKPDFWSRKAFKEGYPARSVYKLKEINDKFGILKKNGRILDLGSSPGSWTVFALKTLNGTGHVTSIDLNPLAKDVKSENLTFIQGDLYDPAVRAMALNEGAYDTLICDAAPPTTGNRVIDTARSTSLAELAIFYAQEMLVSGGNFVVKIFQGGEQQKLLKQIGEIFASARGFKPEACRNESFETYLIGLNKK
ncbi:MAG: SAM-dependent methyltransferase [Treponemataceae bacterium]